MHLRSRSSPSNPRVQIFTPATTSPYFDTPATPPSKKRKAADSPRKPTPTKIKKALAVPHPTPSNWKQQYDLIFEQRKHIVAPVDTVGCDALNKDPTIPEKDRRFQVLVSLILSSQTKDPVTAQATENLRSMLPGGCSVDSVLAATDTQIQDCINKVGFWRRKTDYLKGTARILRDKHNSDVPKTVDELIECPGVAAKVALLTLNSAWGISAGIGVDVHVHRLTNRLGWHNPPTKDPEETRVNLESWLPYELHDKINVLFVGFGQMICTPIGPKCDQCDLANYPGLCPSKRGVKVTKSRLKKEETLEDDDKAKVLIEVEETKRTVEGDIRLEEPPAVVLEERIVKKEAPPTDW